MRRSKIALMAGVLASIHVIALFAEFFAPYSFAEQQRSFSYSPPTRLRWIDRHGQFHWRPFVYGTADGANGPMQPLHFCVRGWSYRLAGLVPWDRHLFGVARPGAVFLLGADEFGRDQFSRLLAGSRISLSAGWLAAILSLGIGAALGAIAGLAGAWLDDCIMRISEASLALPWIYLLLAGRAILPLDLPSSSAYLILISVVGVLGWARPARLIRGLVLSLRERAYVVAASSFGATPAYLVRVHLLPDALPVVTTQAALLVPQYILAEVTLSFLGLGIDEPSVSWGSMLAGVQHYHVLVSYWWMLLPALAPAAVSLCCFTIADALLSRRGAIPL
jgi:peptide/nickel transport system permease protein